MLSKTLDPEDFTLGIESIVAPAWSNYSASLTSFFTSSIQDGGFSGNYYTNVYNSDPRLSSTSEVQFSVTYGDAGGSGSLLYNIGTNGLSFTRTVYGQFVNLLLGEDEGASFNFGTPTNSKNFYALVIDRARYKQTIMPGSFQLRLSGMPDIYITDNSNITSSIVGYTNAGRRYTLGSGSFGDGVMPSSVTTGVYGYLYPDVGIVILNPSSLTGVDTVRSNNTNFDNNVSTLISNLTQLTLQSQETITSNYIFCRARNNEFNFSTQNSFISSTRNITGSSNAINNDFIKTPPTYITSVGLYNDNQELLAVAKLSKPLKKDFTTEALIRVKLDF
jgi:hypothetical protein